MNFLGNLNKIYFYMLVTVLCLSGLHAQAPAVCGFCTDECWLVTNGYGFAGNFCSGPTGPHPSYEVAVEACLYDNGCITIPINMHIWFLLFGGLLLPGFRFLSKKLGISTGKSN